MGHCTCFVVTCNELSLDKKPVLSGKWSGWSRALSAVALFSGCTRLVSGALGGLLGLPVLAVCMALPQLSNDAGVIVATSLPVRDFCRTCSATSVAINSERQLTCQFSPGIALRCELGACAKSLECASSGKSLIALVPHLQKLTAQ
jgi:hypothetical protein